MSGALAHPTFGSGVTPEFRPELEIDGPAEQRRVTVFFRLLLALPHFFVLFFLAIAAFFVTIAGWFAALVLGRLPDGIAAFLSGYLAWSTRVTGYVQLLVDRYPPFAFDDPGYPLRIELRPGALNRLAVLFRLILGIPALIVTNIVSTGWAVCALFLWIAVLIVGRTPLPVFGATAAEMRYSLRWYAYMMMLTSAYPKRLFGDPAAQEGASDAEAASAGRGTRPLVLSQGARVLLIVFIVTGVIASVSQGRHLYPPPPEYSAATGKL